MIGGYNQLDKDIKDLDNELKKQIQVDTFNNNEETLDIVKHLCQNILK